MSRINVINVLSLLVYVLIIGCILYHMHWLRMNKEKVNDISRLIAYEPKFPRNMYLKDINRYQGICVKHAIVPGVLLGIVVTFLILGVRSFFYPPEAIYCDDPFEEKMVASVFLGSTIVTFIWYLVILSYSSKPELQIGTIAAYAWTRIGGVEFNRDRILRRKWFLFCIFFTAMWLIIRFSAIPHAYMTETEYVRYFYLIEKHCPYEDIQSLDIDIYFEARTEGYHVYYNLRLKNGDIVEDWGTSPLYSASISEKKEILEFISRKGVEIHKQKLTRDEVAFINGHGGAPFIEAIFAECKEAYPELWLPDNEFATTSSNGKRLTVNLDTHQVEVADDEVNSNEVRLFAAIIMFPGICMFLWGLYGGNGTKGLIPVTKFRIHMPFRLSVIGSLCISAAVYFALGLENPGGLRDYGVWTVALGLGGLVMAVLPVKGIYEIKIKDQDIQIILLKKVRRTYHFNQIRLCEVGKRRIRVYMWDREKKAFDIYKCMPGYENFYQRIQRDGIQTVYGCQR